MTRRKTIYLEIMSRAIMIIFIMLIFVFVSLGITNLSKILWLAISQFGIAAILAVCLLTYYILNYNYGQKYIYFDETGVEFKHRYIQDKLFLHWETIEKIEFNRRIVTINFSSEGQKPVIIKCPYEKCNEIQEEFYQFADSMNIAVEHIRK